jgi:hypothetical protein
MKTFGTITVKTLGGTKEVNVVKLIKIPKEGRIITIAETEGESYLISVENPESSGRGNHSMFLTKESLIILHFAIIAFFDKNETDLHEMLLSIFQNGIDFAHAGFEED